MKIDMK